MINTNLHNEPINLLTLSQQRKKALAAEVKAYIDNTFQFIPEDYIQRLFSDDALANRLMHSLQLLRSQETKELKGFFSFQVEKIFLDISDRAQAPLLALRFFVVLTPEYKKNNLSTYFFISKCLDFLLLKYTTRELFFMDSYLYGEAVPSTYRHLSRHLSDIYPIHHRRYNHLEPVYTKLTSYYGLNFNAAEKQFDTLPKYPNIKQSNKKPYDPKTESQDDAKNMAYYYELNPKASEGYALPTIVSMALIQFTIDLLFFSLYLTKKNLTSLFKENCHIKHVFFNASIETTETTETTEAIRCEPASKDISLKYNPTL